MLIKMERAGRLCTRLVRASAPSPRLLRDDATCRPRRELLSLARDSDINPLSLPSIPPFAFCKRAVGIDRRRRSAGAYIHSRPYRAPIYISLPRRAKSPSDILSSERANARARAIFRDIRPEEAGGRLGERDGDAEGSGRRRDRSAPRDKAAPELFTELLIKRSFIKTRAATLPGVS